MRPERAKMSAADRSNTIITGFEVYSTISTARAVQPLQMKFIAPAASERYSAGKSIWLMWLPKFWSAARFSLRNKMPIGTTAG